MKETKTEQDAINEDTEYFGNPMEIKEAGFLFLVCVLCAVFLPLMLIGAFVYWIIAV